MRDRVRPLAVLLGFPLVYFEWLIYIGYDGPRYYIVFAIGMLVAEVVRNPKAAGLLRSRWAAVLGLAALLAEFLLGATAFSALPPILLAVFLAPVVAGNSYFKILSLKGSVILGEISYGIYLLAWDPVVRCSALRGLFCGILRDSATSAVGYRCGHVHASVCGSPSNRIRQADLKLGSTI